MVLLQAPPSESHKQRATRLSPRRTRSMDRTAIESLQEEQRRTAALATVRQAAEGLLSAADRLRSSARQEPAVWGAFPISRIEIPGDGRKYRYPLRGCLSRERLMKIHREDIRYERDRNERREDHVRNILVSRKGRYARPLE